MKAVVLAGGLGTRLQPIIGEIPKSMLEFNGRPLLEYSLNALKERDVKEYLIVVNFKREMIQQHFGDGSKFGVNIEYVVQENPKGGTANAVSYAAGEIPDRKFFVIYGDNAFDPLILDEILSKADNYDGVLCGKQMQDMSQYGALKIEHDLIKGIAEKSPQPPSNLAFTGLMILPSKIFSAIRRTPISPRGERELTTSIELLAEEGLRFGYVTTERFWLDPKNEEDLEVVKEFYGESNNDKNKKVNNI